MKFFPVPSKIRHLFAIAELDDTQIPYGNEQDWVDYAEYVN